MNRKANTRQDFYTIILFNEFIQLSSGCRRPSCVSSLLSDPAGVGGWHCVPHPERLIANQELVDSLMSELRGYLKLNLVEHVYIIQIELVQFIINHKGLYSTCLFVSLICIELQLIPD